MYSAETLGSDENIYSVHADSSYFLERKGLLRHVVEAKVGRRLDTGSTYRIIRTALDTCSDTPMVRRGAKCLLKGKNLTEATSKDFVFTFRDDMLKHDALSKGQQLPIRTANGTTWTKEYAPVWVRNGEVEGVILARVSDEDNMPPDVDLLLDRDTIGFLKIDVNKILNERTDAKPSGFKSDSSNLYYYEHCAQREFEYESLNLSLGTMWSEEDSKEEHGEDDEWVETQKLNTTFVNSVDDTYWNSPVEHIDPALQSSRVLPAYFETHLSEANCRAKLESKANLFARKVFTLDDLDICPDLTNKQKEALRRLVRKYKKIFAISDDLPDAANEELVSAVAFKVEEAKKVATCMKPRWGKYQEAILRQWVEKGIREGLLVKAPDNCSYSCRPHIVTHPLKPDKIRVCWDNRALNEALTKIAVNTPSMEDQLLRHPGAKFFTSTDALRGFYHLKLGKESQEKLAIWTPLGLYMPTRLVEGNKNAATYFQNFANKVLEAMNDDSRQRTSNYADDFLTSGKDFESYIANTEELFKACQKMKMTLSPKKTQLGYPTAKLLGREISSDKIRVHDDNLKALRNSAIPCTKSELRSFLGICNYARKHVEHFRDKSRVLTNLLKKDVEWKWDSTTKAAYDALRKEVLTSFPLHTMDPTKPLYLSCDASDFGMGACLYQLKKPVADDQLSTMGGTSENKQIIAFYSSSFNPAMQRKPIYYREARAIIWAMEKTVEYTRRSEHQLVVCTDHQPLKWLKNSNRGQVTAWLLENVADIDFRIVYVPGESNGTADIFSRPPMVSPSRYNLDGATQIWRKLLTTLPKDWLEVEDLHVWAAQHTSDMQRVVQASRKERRAIDISSPNSLVAHLKKQAATTGNQEGANTLKTILLAPTAEMGPVVTHDILSANSNAKFACLVQTDLLQYIQSGGTEKIDNAIKDAVSRAAKLTFSRSNYTWIVFNDSRVKDQVFTVEDLRMEGKSFEAVKRSKLNHVFLVQRESQDLESWLKYQKEEMEAIKKEYGDQNVLMRSKDSLVHVQPKEDCLRIYVPTKCRKDLVMQYHKDLEHAMESKMVRAVGRKYAWPKMRKDISSWITECDECPLSKARKTIAHNQYSPTTYRKPRSTYGIDFYGVAESADGHTGVLTAVDLHTRFVQFIPVKNATADTVVRALQRISYERGNITTIVSDGSKSIVGKVVDAYCKAMGIQKISTFYYPQGNAITERNHVILGEFLRRLPEGRRKYRTEDLPKLAYAVNMCTNSTTNYTPFELDTGYTPSAPGDVIFTDKPVEGDLHVDNLLATSAEHEKTIQRVQQLHYLAKSYADAARMVAMDQLNREGGPKPSFKAGEKVAVYIPSSRSPNDGKNPWKAKHTLSWRLGTVVKRKANTTYEVQLDDNTKVVRSVALLQKWKATESVQSQVKERVIAASKPNIGKLDTYEVGDFVATPFNDENEKVVEVAQIVDKLEGPRYTLRYLGTTDKGKKHTSVVLKLAYRTKGDGAMVLGKKPSEPHEAYGAEKWEPHEITGRIQLNKPTESSWKLTKASAEWFGKHQLQLHFLKAKPNKRKRKRKS